MASHLGWPVGLLKKVITVEEFLSWQAYLDDEMNTPGKTEYYLAQIALAVAAGAGARKVGLKDFLNPVKFTRRRPTPMTKQAATIAAKSFWGAGLAGVKIKKDKHVVHGKNR